jgi:hypothetical protein
VYGFGDRCRALDRRQRCSTEYKTVYSRNSGKLILWASRPSIITAAMSINKLFAQDSAALDDCMDQLVEALVKLLEEPQNQSATDAENQVPAAVTATLRSEGNRAINVSVRNSKKQRQGRSCR